jgi:hypothetical protein
MTRMLNIYKVTFKVANSQFEHDGKGNRRPTGLPRFSECTEPAEAESEREAGRIVRQRLLNARVDVRKLVGIVEVTP